MQLRLNPNYKFCIQTLSFVLPSLIQTSVKYNILNIKILPDFHSPATSALPNLCS